MAVVSIDAQDADCLLTSYAVSTRPVIAARVERSAKVQRLPCLQAAVDGADICDYICAMAQLALYVEDDLLKRLDRAAKQAGVSRSRFVARVLAQQLEERLPETFFEVLGSWEDERSPTQIIRDLRRAPRDRRVRVK